MVGPLQLAEKIRLFFKPRIDIKTHICPYEPNMVDHLIFDLLSSTMRKAGYSIWLTQNIDKGVLHIYIRQVPWYRK